MGKSNKFKSHPNATGSGKKPEANKKRKPVNVTAEADRLREQGYHVRRNRIHAASPPQRE